MDEVLARSWQLWEWGDRLFLTLSTEIDLAGDGSAVVFLSLAF